MAPSRPTMAFILALLGGLFILLGGVVYLFVRSFFSFFAVLGIACGTIVLLAAILFYRRPAQHATWGAIALVFGIVSLPSFGGFLVGLVLAVVGGALAIAWKPGGTPSAAYAAGPYGVPVAPWRMCMGCGRWIPWAYNVCPLCGTAAPVAPWAPRASGESAGDAANASTPAAPFAPPRPLQAPCPTCSGQAEWAPHMNQWYCPAESRYF